MDTSLKTVNDPDLKFLERIGKDQAKRLADIIIHDAKDKQERWNQRLSKNLDYKDNVEEQNNVIGLIVEELLWFGGDTIANIFRQKGVTYKTIVCDICSRLHIHHSIIGDCPAKYSVMRLEKNIIERTLEIMLINSTDDELENIYKEFCETDIKISEENRDEAIESIMENAMPLNKMKKNTANYLLKILEQREDEQPKWYRDLCKYVQTPNLSEVHKPLYNPITGPAFRVLFPAVLCISCQRIIESLNN